MYLLKNKNGNYTPVDDVDYEASKKIKAGSVVKVSQARNYQFHKKAFALLNLGFENQDRHTSFDIYRKIKTMEAGYVLEGFDKNGVVQLLPESLSYDTMSSENFDKWYNATLLSVAEDMESKPETIKRELESFF